MFTDQEARNSGVKAPELRGEIAHLRRIDNLTNLGFLVFEYVCFVGVIGVSVGFAEFRGGWGLAWSWNVPVFALAILLVGGLQHRLAGLGHEASHYSLLKNKWANDFVGDLFCLNPLVSSVHFYRLFHMAHHQFPNDPERDPDLVNLGPGKRVEDFPMGRWQFILSRFLAPICSPISFLVYQWEYVYVNVLGKGNNIYMRRVEGGDADRPWPRLGTALGVFYILGVIAGQYSLTRSGRADWLIPAGLIAWGGASLVIALLPGWATFRSPFRQPYSTRFGGIVRLGLITATLVALGWLHHVTHGRSAPYFFVLWCLPLMTTFPYFMLLRDTYQHTNADTGRLTNSRVFYCDPLTRWAVFVYGQDMHVPHHLFPSVPHYHLPKLHQLLLDSDDAYAREVVECHGTFLNDGDRPTILDVLTEPARN